MHILMFDNSLTTPQLAPGCSVQYNRDGSITGKATFNIAKDYAGSPNFGDTPAYLLSHPNVGDAHPKEPAAKLVSVNIVWDEVKASYLCEYVGMWASNSTWGTTVQAVDGVAQTSQEPIVAHKNWSSIGGYAGAPQNGAVFSDQGEFQFFPAGAPNNLGGVQSYLWGGLTIRIRYTTAQKSTVIAGISMIGRSVNTVLAGLITYSNALYRMALCTSVTYNEVNTGSDTGIWIVTEEYTFCDSPGWNPLIYP